MNRKFKKLKLQSEYCGNRSPVLDIGFSASPNPYLKNVKGVDLLLPKILPSNYMECLRCNLNSENLPFESNTFNCAIAGDVIEHLENPSHFLREINRVSKLGGRLVLSTPQANDWWTTLHNWFFRKWINDPDPGEHLQNWTILDMTRLLRKNGFKLEYIHGYYMRFPFSRLKIRVKRFPILSWQVFYIASKIDSPNTRILTRVDSKWQNVP